MDIKASKREKGKSIKVFCCYAREDQQFLVELKKHLTPLEREGLITLWADIDIHAGMEWEKELHRHLNTAQVILLLVSSDFIASEYCYSVEMHYAMKRHERGEALVIPIIVRPTFWQNTHLGKLQALPADGISIIDRKWHHQDEAFYSVVEGLRDVLNVLEKKASGLEHLEKDVALSPHPRTLKTIPHEQVSVSPSPNQEDPKQLKKEISFQSANAIPDHNLIEDAEGHQESTSGGQSLKNKLQKNKEVLPEAQVIKWMMLACEVLEKGQYINIDLGEPRTISHPLHYVNPDNILITPDQGLDIELYHQGGQIHFIISPDYHLSHAFTREEAWQQTSSISGILSSYAAPEVLASTHDTPEPGHTDIRTGIYSIGALTYYLLTNCDPDPLVTPLPGSILAKNTHLRTRKKGRQIICPVEQVIIKAMQQGPEKRFQTANAMRRALQACLEE